MVRARFLTIGVAARGGGQNDPCANGLELETQYETLILFHV